MIIGRLLIPRAPSSVTQDVLSRSLHECMVFPLPINKNIMIRDKIIFYREVISRCVMTFHFQTFNSVELLSILSQRKNLSLRVKLIPKSGTWRVNGTNTREQIDNINLDKNWKCYVMSISINRRFYRLELEHILTTIKTLSHQISRRLLDYLH